MGEENKKNSRKWMLGAGMAALLVLAFVIGLLTPPIFKSGKSEDVNTVGGTTAAENAEKTNVAEKTETSGAGEERNTDAEGEETRVTEVGTTVAGENTTTAQASDETTAAGASAEGLTVTVGHTNEWGDAPHYIQLDGKIVNGTDKTVDGWTVEIAVGDATVDQNWSGNCSIADGVLTVTNVDYNEVLAPGGSCDFGVIICDATGDLSATITAGSFTDATDQNQSNNQNQGNNNQGSQTQVNATALPVPDPTTDDWLSVKGNKIVDKDGNEVWLTGINWFGYNTGTNTFDGLWACDLNTSLQAIANRGFNLMRIPISAELILQWKNEEYPTANFNQATNSYLVGMNSLEIFDYIVGQCRANGIKIMMDIHCAKTDSMGHMVNLWYTDTISTEDYIAALTWMAERYAEDDTILAYDLKNEPHGKPYESDKAIWNDSTDENNWKYAAERTALAIFEKNPNVLVMVEGTEIYPVDIKTNGDYSSTNDDDYYFNWWGGNLRGVADFPVELGQYQDKLVYSPHDYGPAVYQQPWFYDGYDYDSLYEDCWYDNWFYIYDEDIAPLLIGEWGGYMTEPNLTWMTHLRTLIKTYRLNHTFWCFNSNSGDTGGLVKDDFVTWDEEKYAFVKEVLWQEDGKFVGLDHEIPLGTAGDGISLGELYSK
jgi:hypothetical protein